MLNEALENPKHEMFAQMLFAGETTETAYVEAGYRANRGNSARLRAHERVVFRLDQLRSQNRIKAGVTKQSLSMELDEVRVAAFNDQQYGVAATAIMGKAKLHGLLTEKVEHSHSGLADLLREIDGTTRGLQIIDITPDNVTDSQDDGLLLDSGELA